MSKLKEWVLAHKGLSIALLVGVVVLIYLYSKRSSAASSAAASAGGLSSSDYASIQNTEVAAATQLQAQQLAAQQQTNQLQAQLQATQLQESTQLATAQLEQQVSLANIYANQNVQLTTVGAQKDVAIATLQENTAVASDQASIELGLINILAGKGNTYTPTVAPAAIQPTLVSSGTTPAVTNVSPAAEGGTTQDATGIFSQTNVGPLPAVVGFVGAHPLEGPAAPGAALTGYSEIPGVSYPAPTAPFAADYTYPSQAAAEAAGALVLRNGMYVPANPGLQITY